MKKILSLITLLTLVLALGILLTSCGGISVDDVKEDTSEFLADSTDKTIEFFLDDDKALSENFKNSDEINGSKIYLDLPAGLVGGSELEFSLTTIGKDDKSSATLVLDMNGEKYSADMYHNESGIAVKGPSLFGFDDVLLINPESIGEKLLDSDLMKALGFSSENEGSELASPVWTKLLSKINIEELTEKIQKTVTPEILEEEYEGENCIVITYKIDSNTVFDVLDLLKDEAKEAMPDYKEELDNAVAEIKREFEEDSDISVEIKSVINAKTSVFAYTSIEGNVMVDDDRYEFDLITTVSENEIKTELSATVDGDKIGAEIVIEQAVEEKESIYTAKINVTEGGKSTEVASLKFTYQKDNGDFTLNISTDTPTPITLNGKIESSSSKTAVVISSVKYQNVTVDITLGIELLRNAKPMEMPEGAKDITEITEAEWLEIFEKAYTSPLGELIHRLESVA